MLRKYLKEKYKEPTIDILTKTNINRENDIASFNKFYLLMKFIRDYSFHNGGDAALEHLKRFCKFINYPNAQFPLPHKGLGNALAVALQMHEYTVALDMIKNPNDYNVKLDNVAVIENKTTFSAEEVFDYSLLSFIDKKTLTDNELKILYTDDEISDIKQRGAENEEAAEEIAKIFTKNNM